MMIIAPYRFTPLVPDIGEYWEEHGGYYGGTITYLDSRKFHLILASKTSEVTRAWKTTNTFTDAYDDYDGVQNMTNIITNGITNHPAADYCNEYTNAGFDDWYLLSRWEMRLITLNLDPTKVGQHPDFATGGSQALPYTGDGTTYFWSSTAVSTTQARYIFTKTNFSFDGSWPSAKDNPTAYVRPARRIPV